MTDIYLMHTNLCTLLDESAPEICSFRDAEDKDRIQEADPASVHLLKGEE